MPQPVSPEQQFAQGGSLPPTYMGLNKAVFGAAPGAWAPGLGIAPGIQMLLRLLDRGALGVQGIQNRGAQVIQNLLARR